MNKCDKCNKNITARSPGLECARCEKIVHSTMQCSGLSKKQISALRAAETLEWTCRECLDVSGRKPSFVIPDDDDEDDEETSTEFNPLVQVDANKLLKNITAEVQKALNKELKELKQSMQFHSEKMDEVLESVHAFKQTIIDLKRKLVEVTNKNNNLETRVGALEQHIQQLEQKQLSNHIDISNVPLQDQENVKKITETLAKKLSLPKEDIISTKRISGRKDHPGPIRVMVKDDDTQEKWLTVSKGVSIHVNDLIPNMTTDVGGQKVYINEALTPYNRKLLWNAKQHLKNTFKFIWCKKGTIMARKSENEKPIIVRSLSCIKLATNEK